MPFQRNVQNTAPALAAALAEQYKKNATNAQKSGGLGVMHYARVDASFARDKSTPGATSHEIDFTPVAALNNAGCQARANLLRAALLAHLADGSYAHSGADSTSSALVTAPACSDVASCSTLLADLQAAFNSHKGILAVHSSLAVTNPATTITANDAASNITALNELLLLYQRHFYAAREQIRIGAAG